MRLQLTKSQRDILRLDGYVGGAINNICCDITVCGKADLDKVVARLYRKYPILNTVYSPANEAIVDKESSATTVSKVFESADSYVEWAASFSSTAMDITKELSVIIPFSINGSRSGLFIKVHHLICDGFSMKLMIESLTRLLDGNDDDTVPPSYEEFIDEDAVYAVSRKRERDSAFYRELFAQGTQTAFLSENESRDFSAQRYAAVIPKETIERLTSFAATANVSFAQLLEATYAVTLFRIHGEKRFYLGNLLANRLNPREEQMFGNMFVTSVLPISVDEGTTFRDLTKAVSDIAMPLMRHQRLPFSDIYSIYREAGGVSSRLFDVLYNYQSFDSNDKYQICWYPASEQNETLLINVEQNGDSVVVNYDYRSACISPEQIRRLHNRWCELVTSALASPDEPVYRLNQLSADDKRFIDACNHTTYPYPKDETLISLFEKQVVRTPEATALFFGDKSITYAEFAKRIDLLAGIISGYGVLPGSVVGLRIERSFDMMTAIYAIQKCGAAYMPIGTDYPADRVSFMLKDSGATLLLTKSIYPIEVEGVHVLNTDSISWSTEVPSFTDRSKPELPAYVLYTSGSTGTPKGAIIAQKSIVARIWWMNRIFGMEVGDVILQKTVYTFDVSLWELFWWSMFGGSLAILEPEAHKDPQKVIDAVKRYHVTKMHFVPSMLAAFLAYAAGAAKPGELASLRQVFASGEALMPAHVNEFYRQIGNAELINLYGPTECTVDVSCFRCPRTPVSVIPIGAPVDNTQLYVVDKYMNQVPVGETGELCIAGDLVGMGYLNRPELTAEKFIDNPFGPGKLYKTGDLARWSFDGNVEYLGRIDFQVKLHGQRLELGEIERCMAEYPGVKQAVAAVNKDGDQFLAAYYTSDGDVDEVLLKDHLSAKLPAYMVPQAFMRLAELPLTVSGKTDRKKLPKITFVISNTGKEKVMPSTSCEKDICKAFSHALGIDESSIGIDDDFFALGGDSLRAIGIMIDLHAEYGFTIQDIYECKTVRALAAKAQAASETDDSVYDDDWAYEKLDLPDCEAPVMEETRGILVTGSTGLLGVHILHKLLEATDKHIYCLVRSEKKLLDHWAYMFDDELFPAERVTAIIGDISKEMLGLEEPLYSELLAKVGAVYHSAADVRHFGVWEDSYKTNTLGTRHIVDFCISSGACLNHISTMSVNGHLLATVMKPNAVFDENTLFFGQRYLENVYVRSKYLAERLIIDEIRAGQLKANIYRVGNLLWRRSDCKFQKNKSAHDFFMLSRAFAILKCYPENFKDFDFDLTPVDDCAESIVKLSAHKMNHVWHIRNEHMMLLSTYIERLISETAECISIDEMMRRLETHKDDPQMGFMLAYMDINKTFSQNEICMECVADTTANLNQCGFAWQHPSDEYISFALEQ